MGGNDQQRGETKDGQGRGVDNFAGKGCSYTAHRLGQREVGNWRREMFNENEQSVATDGRSQAGEELVWRSLCSDERARMRTRLRLGYQDDVLPGQRV